MFVEAEEKFNNNDYEGALEVYNAIEEKGVSDLNRNTLYGNRGAVLVRLNRPQEALNDLNKVLEAGELGEGEYLPYFNKGVALKQLERYEEALAMYNKALEISPKEHNIYLAICQVLVPLQRYQEAIETVSKLLDADPGSVEGRVARAFAYLKLKQFNEAIKDIEETKGAETTDAEAKQIYTAALASQAAVLDHNKEYDAAAKLIDRAIALEPTDQRYFTKAIIHVHAGQMAEARDALEKCTGLNAERQDAHRLLGDLYLQEKEYGKAAKSLRIALDKAEKPDADGYHNLGFAYLQEKQPNEAIECFKKVLELNPDHEGSSIGLKQAEHAAKAMDPNEAARRPKIKPASKPAVNTTKQGETKEEEKEADTTGKEEPQ
ncbi:trd-1, partial [Symbiodinium sp. KB8]